MHKEGGPANPAELFEPPKLSVDKLPQLRALFERAAAGSIESYKDLLSAPVTGFLNQVEAGDSWDVVDGLENCLAALFYISEWDVQILIAMESRLLASLTDALYGGDGSEPPSEAPRTPSTLDLQIAREIFERTARSLSNALSPLAQVQIAFERIETELDFNVLGPQNIPCVFAQLLFQIYEQGGRMVILVPRAPLMPMRKKLERGTLRESQADDPVWSKQLQSRVVGTRVGMRAIADASPMTLAQVAELQVGQILPVDAISEGRIVLESAATAMFVCSLGQREGRLSVKLENPIESPKGLLDSVLGEAMSAWRPPSA